MIQFLFQRPFHGQHQRSFPTWKTVATNFSTFRFVAALTSAAVFTGSHESVATCRSEGPQYHFAEIKVNPAEAAWPACPIDELVMQLSGNVFSSRSRVLGEASSSRNNVRFGSITDISAYPRHVRFTPKSGHC